MYIALHFLIVKFINKYFFYYKNEMPCLSYVILAFALNEKDFCCFAFCKSFALTSVKFILFTNFLEMAIKTRDFFLYFSMIWTNTKYLFDLVGNSIKLVKFYDMRPTIKQEGSPRRRRLRLPLASGRHKTWSDVSHLFSIFYSLFFSYIFLLKLLSIVIQMKVNIFFSY